MMVGLVENGLDFVLVFGVTIDHRGQLENKVFRVFSLVELVLDVPSFLEGALTKVTQGLVVQVIHVFQTHERHSRKENI